MSSQKRAPTDREVQSANAVENWRRVSEFCRYLGRSESDAALLSKLERWAPAMPREKLYRAQLGDWRGGGSLQKESARALVGPLLGVDFKADRGRPVSILGSYTGPATAARLEYLRSLSDQQLFDLADEWVRYLRRERDTAPEATAESPASAPPPPGPADRQVESVSETERSSKEAVPFQPRRRWAIVLGATLVLGASALSLRGGGAGQARSSRPLDARSAAAQVQPMLAASQAAETRSLAGGPSASLPAPSEAARVQVECERGGERFVLADRARVREKDRLTLEVEVDEPLFATLALLAADSTLKPLYPKQGSVPIPPKQRTRLPRSRTQYFSPNHELGVERLLLFFTTAPLTAGLAPALPWLERLQREGRWPEDWPLPGREDRKVAAASETRASGESTLLTRGIVVSEASRKPNELPELVHLQLLTFDHRSADR